MTMLGEFCARCGAKSTINLEPAPGGGADVQVYRCPNGHGIQLITAAPAPEMEPPLPETEPPLDETEITETGFVQWAVAEADTDIALTTTPTTVEVGSVFRIDAEYMTVNNISNPDNPGVTRATHGSVLAAHEAEVEVLIWGTVAPAVASASVSTKAAAPKKK